MTRPTTASLPRITVPVPPAGRAAADEPGLPADDELPPGPSAGTGLPAVADDELPPEPSAGTGLPPPGARLIRFRVRADHHGLRLRAGETVLCVPYEPAELGMVVLVRCESDGHAPGVLLSVRELDYLEEAGRHSGDGGWDEPGTRAWPAAERSWRPAWLTRRRK